MSEVAQITKKLGVMCVNKRDSTPKADAIFDIPLGIWVDRAFTCVWRVKHLLSAEAPPPHGPSGSVPN